MRPVAIAFAAVTLLLLHAPAAQAADWELDVDARLVSSDAGKSHMDGGVGAVRFSEDQSGLRLGRARLGLDQPFGDVWSLHIDASAWGDNDRNPVDLTEAYLQFRPYPFAGSRFRLKAGAFYAPISLENRAVGWESPYTLSYSAINTWLAEELRTIGVEGQWDWLGTRQGHSFDVGLVGGIYGWNDPAGVVLATRGFALSDRQTSLFGRVGAPGKVFPLQPVELFREIDGHAGYYAGGEVRYFDRLTLRALHYDNRADPTAMDASIHQFAWTTHFDSAGARAELQNGWTAIVQWLRGETYVAPPSGELGWPFRARFALLSRAMGHHRLSVRYDAFEVDTDGDYENGEQRGHAWTAAYVYESGTHWRVTLEWLKVFSYSANREQVLGQSEVAQETQVQLAVRYAIGSSAY